MSFEPCPDCGESAGRSRVQVASFHEDTDGGTEYLDWGTLLKDECAECGHVFFEHDLLDRL